jgi:HEAT repeat protein
VTDEEPRFVVLLHAQTPRAEYERLAELYRWRVVEELPGDNDRLPYEEIRVTLDGRTIIHYLDDPVASVRYLVVHGPKTRAVAFNLGRSFDIELPDAVLERVRSATSDDEKAHGAFELAVAFREYSEEAANVLRKIYEGGNTRVRHAAINAIGYRGWPEARALFEQILREEQDPTLRENAQALWSELWGRT